MTTSSTPTPGTRQRVCVLGATGSVGAATLDVVAAHPHRFEVFAVTAHRRLDELFVQCVRFRPRYAVVASAAEARVLADRLRGADDRRHHRVDLGMRGELAQRAGAAHHLGGDAGPAQAIGEAARFGRARDGGVARPKRAASPIACAGPASPPR